MEIDTFINITSFFGRKNKTTLCLVHGRATMANVVWIQACSNIVIILFVWFFFCNFWIVWLFIGMLLIISSCYGSWLIFTYYIFFLINTQPTSSEWELKVSAGFTYRLDRLKPRAIVYNTFDTVIGLAYLCCHKGLYVLSKQPFSNFPCIVALHFRILSIFYAPLITIAFVHID